MSRYLSISLYLKILAVRLLLSVTTLVTALAGARVARAEAPFFMGLGDLPGGDFHSQAWDVSADGKIVVGGSWADESEVDQTFRWTRETGMVGLPMGGDWASRISADGSTIIQGDTRSWGRWTSETGFVPIAPAPYAQAFGISGDGSVIVGKITTNATYGYNSATRWSAAGGLVGLLGPNAMAWDISSDGSVTLIDEGYGIGPCILSFADGIVYLAEPELNASLRVAGSHGRISDNGKVVVGGFDPLGGAFRWTKETGVVVLDPLPDGVGLISPRGVSADGSIIVGNANISSPTPFIWDPMHGARYLADVLTEEAGLGEAMAGWSLRTARGVSGDGRTVIGYGINPNGKREGWIAYLGTTVPVAGDYDGNGRVDAADYVMWRNGGPLQNDSTPSVQPADYDVWRAHFGQTAASGSSVSAAEFPAGVPEPNMLTLGGLASCALVARRRLKSLNDS